MTSPTAYIKAHYNGENVKVAALYDTKQENVHIVDSDTSITLPVKGNLCVRALTPIAKNTKIFMPFNDPDKPMKDICGNSWAVSKALTITEDNSKFGKCAYFDGSTWFQSNNAFPLFGQDFTISFWALPIAHSTPSAIGVITLSTSKRKSANRIQFEHIRNTTLLGMYIGNIGGLNFSMSSAAYNTDQMNHYAVTYVHETGTWYYFLNGVLKGTKTNAKLSRLNFYVIGGVHSYFDSWFQGYLEDVVIIDGTALWTSDFTPPDKPYSMTQTLYAPLVLENSPPAYAQTKALLHFDDPDNPLKDECGNEWFETGGNESIDTDTAKFGGALHKNSNVLIQSPQIFHFHGQPLTFDFWCYETTATQWTVNVPTPFQMRNYDTYQLADSGGTAVADFMAVMTSVNEIWLYGFNDASALESTHISFNFLNLWVHFALTHSDGYWTLFVNGTKKISYYKPLRSLYYSFSLGTNWYRFKGTSNTARACRFRGYFDEFRFVDGVALYTENFTPPDAPYTIETYNGKNPPCIGVRRDGNNFYTV